MIKNSIPLLIISAIHFSLFAQDPIQVEGVIVDASNETLPYTAVGILSKYIGTVSNDDGAFILKLDESNLNDTLSFSTMGYKTFKIRIQDYLDSKKEVVILEEDFFLLNDIEIKNPITIVKEALKKLKETTYKKPHQLNILYRRFSNENNISRFLVEHFIKVLDAGPTSSTFSFIEIAQARMSNDYRFAKKKQTFHAVNMIAKQNPLRKGISLNKFKWKIIDDSSYDGEDVIIIEGKEKKNTSKWIRLYIGDDTKSIYKLEKSDLNAVYIYKKNKDGKMVLSYHNREYVFWEDVTPYMKKLLKLKENKIKLSYRHEAIVLGIGFERKKIKVIDNISQGTDMGDYDVVYKPDFWKNLNLPPDSKFYKTSSEQLESLYGIPIETQFKRVK